MTSLRWWLIIGLVLAGVASWLAGSSAPDSEAHLRTRTDVDRLDRALTKASRFLLAQQAPDGAWRSEVYGTFKEGASLTPLVVQALRLAPASTKQETACRRGIDYLATFVRPNGVVQPGPHGFRVLASLGLQQPGCGRHVVLDATAASSDENARLRPNPPATWKSTSPHLRLKLEPYAVHYWSLE